MELGSRRDALVTAVLGSALMLALASADDRVAPRTEPEHHGSDGGLAVHVARELAEGKKTFRFDTFGDEAFWGGALAPARGDRRARRSAAWAPACRPAPRWSGPEGGRRRRFRTSLERQLRQGQVDLDDPATTLALLRLNAVVGVKGFFDRRPGCARSGSSARSATPPWTTPSLPGIGRRLDGWANRDLDVGKIVERSRPTCSRSRPARRRRGRRCAPCSRAGGRASSTPSSSSTARPCGPTASRPRR